ncbi:MAG: hypothetical protein ACOZCL_14040 [Bacillota bacterium]
MSVNNEYKRYFIILQEDDKGYEISAGKIPTGYVKIEIKNGKAKITAFVQNVKTGERAEYRFLLIAPAKKVAVDIGKIIIDSSGRGELSYEFESDNVLKSNLDMSQFTVAAVTGSNAIPLSGYVGKDRLDWKNNYEVINRHERIDKKIEKPVEVQTPVTVKPIPIGETVPVEKVAPVENVVPEKPKMPPKELIEIQEEYEEMPIVVEAPPIIEKPQKPVHKEMPEIQEVMELPEIPDAPPKQYIKKTHVVETEIEAEIQLEIDEMHEKVKQPCYIKDEDQLKCEYYYDDDSDSSESEDDDRDKECMKCDECKKHEYLKDEDIEDYYDYEKYPPYYDSPMYRKLEKAFDRLRKYEPFDDKEKDYKWFKVGDDIHVLNNAAIPFMGSIMPLGYPFMMEECALMLGNKDYIIGVKYDRINKKDDRKHIKNVYFGVPGIYNKREEMYYKMRGYTYFRPHKTNSYGYWIMSVDIRNGMIKV